MVVWLVLVAAALAVGGLLAAVMLHDPGYVLVAYSDVTLETSLWLALGALLGVWLVVAVVGSLIRHSRAGGTRLAGWLRGRRHKEMRARSVQGSMLLAEHRWRDAEMALREAAENAEGTLGDYLGAARAANHASRFEPRDDILDKASQALPEAAFAVELVRSELQQAAGQWQRSVATLATLRRQAPRHPLVLTRLFEAHRALGDWEALAELSAALPAEVDAESHDVQAAIWRSRLAGSRHSADAEQHVRNTWKAMPKRLHDDEALLLEYADRAAAVDAEAAVRQALGRVWRASWVRRYGTLDGEVGKRRKTAESWLNSHADDADLLLTLGRLARQDDDAGQAAEYLQRSLRVKRDAETLVEMGALATGSGDHAAANGYYREALDVGRG